MRTIDEVMSLPEAAEIWGVSTSTIKVATGVINKAPKFRPNEARKSKGTWLVTRKGMSRVFGEPKGKKEE